ncbi:MAG: Phosphonate-transporting ATPase [Firmicutes bacterium]|nr:Phosphonate-transporting ATPase [Bacillota bacterium]
MERSGKPFINLCKLIKTFKSEAGIFHALKGVDLQVRAGEFLAIVGKSGSGKSTMLNMLTGIDRPTSGEVWIGQDALHTFTENQMAIWRGQNMGIVFQFFQLIPTLTIAENIMLPMDFSGKYSAVERRKRAMNLLEIVDMAEQAHKLPSAISGGQQQRVAIARALANDPAILVADEPTGNLDSKTADAIFALFISQAQSGKTIVMVTHDNDLASKAGRLVTIADGEIIDSRPGEAANA